MIVWIMHTDSYQPTNEQLKAERLKFDLTRSWRKRIQAGAIAGTHLSSLFQDLIRQNPQLKSTPDFPVLEKQSHYILDRGQPKYPYTTDAIVYDIPAKNEFSEAFSKVWQFIYDRLDTIRQLNLPVGYSLQTDGQIHPVWMAIQSGQPGSKITKRFFDIETGQPKVVDLSPLDLANTHLFTEISNTPVGQWIDNEFVNLKSALINKPAK